MGCCANRYRDSPDKYSAAELSMGLADIPLAEYTHALQTLPAQVTLAAYAQRFEHYEFGQKLASGEDHLLGQVLAHPLFQRDAGLDTTHLFNFGLLYCAGHAEAKVDAAFSFYGLNSQEVPYKHKLSGMISDLLEIAVVIVPAAVDREEPEVLEEQCRPFMEDIRMFAQQRALEEGRRERVRVRMQNELKFLFSAKGIREQVAGDDG